MHIDPTEAPAHQVVAVDDRRHVYVVCERRRWERREKGQNMGALQQVAARYFADHEGVSPHEAVLQASHEQRLSVTQVIHPN